LLRALIGVAILIAAAWIASYATGRGALVSSRHLMGEAFYGHTLPPGATDTPVGHICTYLRYDFVRQQWLVDRDAWDDAHPSTGARPIDNWTSTECPLLSVGLS